MELGVGEALTSFLTKRAYPAMVELHEDHLPTEPHVSAGAMVPGQGDDARRHGEV